MTTPSYYFWSSYKGIVNKFVNTASSNIYKNRFTTWDNLLYRSEGQGNQNYYSGTIGHVSYTNVQVFEEDFFNSDSYGVPEGRFILRMPSGSDSSTQKLTDSSTTDRLSMDSFHSKTGLTSEQIANFYGDFALSKGFNREYRVKTSVALDSLAQGSGRTENSKQARVSLNNNGTYVNVADGEFKIRFTNCDENPFVGVGVVFGFATWPLKEDILLPNKPDKFNTTFALKCFFDEDVTDIQTSHFTGNNCTITGVYKKSASEQWVLFTIDQPSSGDFVTEYTITLAKDSVDAISNSSVKNRTQFIKYTCYLNDGSVIFTNRSEYVAYSTDLGDTWTNTDMGKKEIIRFLGCGYFAINHNLSSLNAANKLSKYSKNGKNWLGVYTGAHNYKNIRNLESLLTTYINDIQRGKDGSGNDLVLACGSGLAYSRDGGNNWYLNGTASRYRYRQHGHDGLGTANPLTTGYKLAYGNGTWVLGGTYGLYYSTDGYSFTQTTSSLTSTATVTGLVYCKDTFIVGANTGEIGYSSDGITWTMLSTKPLANVRDMVSDNSGVVVASGWGDSGNKFLVYTTDKGQTWNDPTTNFNFNQHQYNYAHGTWNGSKFFFINQSTDNNNRLLYSSDGDSWTVKNIDNTGDVNLNRVMSNFFPAESNESEVPGLTKTDVGAVLTLDVSNGLLNVSDIPTTWFQNLTSTTAEEKTREQSTRRNFLFSKIFEGNSTITTFDVSTNGLNMTTNTIKETIKVLKLDTATKTATINLNTDTTITDDKGFYVALENVDEKAKITNQAGDITFDIVRTGTDSDGKATYNVVKTGGTGNLQIDF